jgi:amino acid adenylation domain-containing protein
MPMPLPSPTDRGAPAGPPEPPPPDLAALSGEEKRRLLERLLANRQPGAERFPLSHAQRRLWFLAELNPRDPAYNLLNAYHLEGPLEAGALAAALGDLIARQEALRTRFVLAGREPAQVVAAPPAAPPLLHVDLGALPAGRRRREAHRAVVAAARAPHDLERGLPCRFALLTLAPHDQVLAFLLHHIVADIWSFRVLNGDLAAAYAGRRAGRPADLAPLALRYGEYAAWERAPARAAEIDPQLAYWRRQLAGLEPLELTTDRPRPPVQTSRGGTVTVTLPAALGRRLAGRAAELELSPYMLSLTLFLGLAGKATGRTDLSCGSPITNRHRSELEPLVGLFVNTLVMRVDGGGDPTCRELAARVRAVALAAYSHPEAPFERLVEDLGAARDLSRNPLHQLVFQYGATPSLALAGVRATPCFLLDYGVARADFELHLLEEPAGLQAVAVYNADLLDRATAIRLLDRYSRLLDGALAAPDVPLSALPWLSAGERAQLLAEWNDTAAPEAPPFHLRIAAWAARQPDAVALELGDTFLSYGALSRRAEALAGWLRQAGVGPEVVVALFTGRRPELMIGALAVLAAGGAFLPLDPTYPPERLAFMLADAGATLALTVADLAPALPAGCHRSVVLDPPGLPPGAPPPGDGSLAAAAGPGAVPGPDAAAYLIYTSGSTGQPKGVVAVHRGLANLALCHSHRFGSGPGSRMLHFSSPGFDGWLGEAAIGLGAGATLRLAPPEDLLPGPELARRLAAWGITHAALPPSALAVMGDEPLPALAGLVVASEPCPQAIADLWGAGRRLFNNYGPTEATVGATVDRHDAGRRFTIGRPMPNAAALVLDRQLRPAGIGVPGELCLGGHLLARGYWRQPALTAERFIPHPAAAEPGARLYRTGDLVRWLPDGRLDFCGRIDRQVKVRGFRIEIGEIEAALLAHPAVHEAAVTVWEPRGGDRRLVAYVVPRPGHDLAAADLRRHLRTSLPEHMVPALVVPLAELPRSPHGKLDRRALPAPAAAAAGGGPDYVAPAGGLEEQLAALWREVLVAERVGRDDNFFDLGGNSLLMALLRRRIAEAMDREVPLVDLFRHPSVRALAAFLSRGDDGAVVAAGVGRGAQRLAAAAQRRRPRHAAAPAPGGAPGEPA